MIILDGTSLSSDDVVAVARDGEPVQLSGPHVRGMPPRATRSPRCLTVGSRSTARPPALARCVTA